ncbi:hypothetical protein BH20VER1_BH20VER1_19890 [soil metagenome]
MINAAVPQREKPLIQLGQELDELTTLLSRMQGDRESIQAAKARLTALRAALGRVQAEVSRLQARTERAEREVSEQRVKRADATARRLRAEQAMAQIQESAVWKSIKPLWKLSQRARRSGAAKVANDDITYGVDTPVQWEITTEIALVRGWCFSRSGREIAGVRGKIGRKGRLGFYGIERSDVAAALGLQQGADRCGFTIEMPVPAGVSTLQLEAIVQGGDWEPFYQHEIRRTQTAAEAAGEQTRPQQARDSHNIQTLPRLERITASAAAELLAPPLRAHSQRHGARKPFFSIITPTYNSRPQWLAEAALSLLAQTCDDWEWCLVDDGSTERETRLLLQRLRDASARVRLKFIDNAGISGATNEAVDLASGRYVCLLDHDDLLAPAALEQMRAKTGENYDAIYSDEDKLDDTSGKRVEPFFKPDWSPEYLRGAMYVGHLLCVRRELAQSVRFDSDFDGVQDFDFMLRVGETGARIGHIPQVLYHWRKTPGSIAERTDAKPQIDALQERAVNAHLQRLSLPARAETHAPHRLRMVPQRRQQHPRITIIIPSKDAPELLGRCLGSIFDLTSYPEFEVLVVDNETTDPEALALLSRYPVRRIEFAGKFNFSRANNRGVRKATGEFILFLNNDTEVISADWLQHLLYYAEQPDVGAAGGLLVYEDRTVQHAGVALGMRGTADHTMRGFPLDVDGYAGSLVCAREVSAVTGACLMTRRALFEEIGGYNEHFFTAYQDVDLCLRLRERGMRITYTPGAVVVHHESRSRKGYYDMIDRMLLLDQWELVIERGDPYHNPNLNLERGDYSPACAS